jgi:peptidoglycan DL-endopeptidase CwlO
MSIMDTSLPMPAPMSQLVQTFSALQADSSAAADGGNGFAQLLAALSTLNGSTQASSDTSTSASTDSSGAVTGSALTGGSSVDGSAVVADAKQYLGVPYKWGGTSPITGFDCSGFVQHVFSDLGISLPRVAADQATQGQAVASMSAAQPGDLLAFGSPVDHIAIYLGGGMMIDAPHTGANVRIEPVWGTPTAIRRIVPATATPGVSAAVMTGGAGTSLSSLPYSSDFTSAAARYGVSASLLAAVAHTESGFNPSAVSPAGAEGIMQLMPGTAASLGVNPYDPAQAIDGAAKMLSGLIREFGSVSLAVAAYNAGPGAVQQYGGIPPYPETQAYVQKVLDYQGSLT